MSIEMIVILAAIVVGFILTWIFCGSTPDTTVQPPRDLLSPLGDSWELNMLRSENRCLSSENRRLRDNQCNHFTHFDRCTVKPSIEEFEKVLGIKRPEEPKEFKVEGTLRVKS